MRNLTSLLQSSPVDLSEMVQLQQAVCTFNMTTLILQLSATLGSAYLPVNVTQQMVQVL
jgi:hypothetical protein